MRNVKRIDKPESLREYADTWTTELMEAIEKFRLEGVPIPKHLPNRYKNDDVLDALKRMYNDEDGRVYCCYCEAQISVVNYPHIEHRKPKAHDLFPEHTYNWENLHLACEICNRAKSTKWDRDNEILDAVSDVPISNHLGYCGGSGGIYRETLSNRGITTVIHADLDRPTLRKARMVVYVDTLNTITEIKALGNNPRAFTALRQLKDKCSGVFGSMIKSLLDKFFPENRITI